MPKKYNLSPKACQGILRRCDERSVIINPTLRKVLELQAEDHTTTETTTTVGVEIHSQDSRIKVRENVSQTLSAKMGQGGGKRSLCNEFQGEY